MLRGAALSSLSGFRFRIWRLDPLQVQTPGPRDPLRTWDEGRFQLEKPATRTHPTLDVVNLELTTTMPDYSQQADLSESDARRLLSTRPTDDFVATLRRVLKAYRPGGCLTVNQAAELAGMSVRSLQRRLATEGLAFSEIVEEIRAELATEMLETTDRSVNEIANELGYSSRSNFSRAFQRWTGKTPAEFRRDRG